MGLLKRALSNWPTVGTPEPEAPQMLRSVVVLNPPSPLEGTSMSLWNSILPNVYSDLDGTSPWGNAQLAERVWVTNVCQDLTAAQIAAMPLKWHGSAGVDE